MTGPKVTEADIEGEIASEHYFTAAEGVVGTHVIDGHTVGPHPGANDTALGLLTFCVLVLRNGFTVTGESACVSPDNFNAEFGREIARKKAIDKLWPLLGFRLQDWLHADKPVWVGIDYAAKFEPHAWDLLKPGAVVEVPPDAVPAPQPSADDLAEGIADAARDYHRLRNEEHQLQDELDHATERRRKLLTSMAQATQDRERAAEKLLAATAPATPRCWRTARPCTCGDKEA